MEKQALERSIHDMIVLLILLSSLLLLATFVEKRGEGSEKGGVERGGDGVRRGVEREGGEREGMR